MLAVQRDGGRIGCAHLQRQEREIERRRPRAQRVEQRVRDALPPVLRRNGDIADVALIEHVQKVCVAEHRLPRSRDEKHVPVVRQLAGQLPDDRHVFLIAAAGETVLGYANFLHVLDEGDIGNVAVAPEHRRQGIADALLDALCARAAALDLAFLTLEVRASNAPAIALYRKHGFQTVGQRRNYYQKPDEDALLMTWFRREAETI